MAFLHVEASTLLVRKEGLNAESLLVPVAGLGDEYHIRDQVDGFLALGFPPCND